jgi:Flp pilus assembly protein TadG
MNVLRAARRRADAPRLRRVRDDSGAVAVEFALILPILVMLLLGVTTAGLTYSDHLAITNAAREGGRFGSAVNYDGIATQWADSVQTRVQQAYYNSGSTLTTSQICVQLVNPAASPSVVASPTAQGSTCSSNVPTNPSVVPGGSCLVKVWVKKPAKIELGVFSIPSFNIAATSVSYYGRVSGSCTAG